MKYLYAFFFRQQNTDKNFLAFFRVSIGGFCLLRFLAIKRDFFLLYSKEGIIPADIGGLFKTKFIPSVTNYSDFMNVHFGFSEHTSLLLFQYIYISLAVLIIFGLMTRSSSILLLILQLMLSKGTHLFAYGVDCFTIISLFYCCVFPIGLQNSLDTKWFKPKNINPTPYRRLLQLHLCMIYFFSGLDKLVGFNWWNGESIWKAIHEPYFNLDFGFNFDFMATHPFIPIAIGWCTIVTELLYPLFIWRKRSRDIWLMLVISMHLGIAIVLNLYFFSTLMVLLNLSALLNLSGEKETIRNKSSSFIPNLLAQRIFKSEPNKGGEL